MIREFLTCLTWSYHPHSQEKVSTSHHQLLQTELGIMFAVHPAALSHPSQRLFQVQVFVQDCQSAMTCGSPVTHGRDGYYQLFFMHVGLQILPMGFFFGTCMLFHYFDFIVCHSLNPQLCVSVQANCLRAAVLKCISPPPNVGFMPQLP